MRHNPISAFCPESARVRRARKLLQVARMAPHLPLAFGLLGAMCLLSAAAGCTSNSTGDGTADGAAMTPDGESDASASCTVIHAASYDQSCATATDCAMVGEGSFCLRDCQPCPYAVINVGATAAYDRDVAAALSGDRSTVSCGVCAPAPFAACCLAGKCHADSQCPAAVPAGDAAADAPADAAADAPADAAADAPADACAPPIVCSGACVSGAHNASHLVDGCLVWQCCVPDDAGSE
jgi:hypothetical protein